MSGRGKLIVLEGIDGAGKSTHLGFICEAIARHKHASVIQTREPGGTPLAESIRGLVLHQAMDVQTEVLLVSAARRDHVTTVMAPALARGQWVVCDRFLDSTRAYQGGGGGASLEWIDRISEQATQGLIPDRIYLFDAPADLAAARRGHRGQASDRFEEQDVAYFERVRSVYLTQQQPAYAAKTLVIDSSQSVSRIQSILENDISSL